MIELPVTLTSTGGAVSFASPVPLGYTKNKGVYRLLVTAEGEWEGLTIRCFWHLPGVADPASSLVQDGAVDVPASVTAQPGNGCITFEGSDGVKTVTSADLRYRVGSNSGTEDGTMPEPGTPAWEQLVSETAVALEAVQQQIGNLDDLTTKAKETLVAAINEAARTGSGGAGSITMRTDGGYIQYSTDDGSTWVNLIALAELKGKPGENGADGAPGQNGADGAPGADGYSPTASVEQSTDGVKITITDKSGTTKAVVKNGKDGANGRDGADGQPGRDGTDGITPTIGDNGNWYLGGTDTGKPSRGADGATGATGATGEKGTDGKSAYQYAVDGGYTGTEAEFAEKLAQDIPPVDSTLTKAGQSADAKATGDAIRSLSEEIVATSESKVAAHNTGTDTHSDIRLLIQGLTDRINALADSDDTTLDQLSEVVAYIKSNRGLIEAITTSKVSVADIVDNLTTNVTNKPLSAAQGVALKALIDTITIPEALPNPNALTFTGAVTGSYDGSAPLSVEIPSGGGSGGSADTSTIQETVLASGTVSSGTAKWHRTDTGLTASDLKKWKIWGFRCVGTTGDNGIFVGNAKMTLSGIKCQAILGWADSERKAIQIIDAVSNGGFEGIGKSFFKNDIGFSSAQMGWFACFKAIGNETDAVYIYTHDELTADLQWEIRGLIK